MKDGGKGAKRDLHPSWMKQYSMFMHVMRTLASWKISHTSAAWLWTKAGLVKRSYSLDHSAMNSFSMSTYYGILNSFARQIPGSSYFSSLPVIMAVRQTMKSDQLIHPTMRYLGCKGCQHGSESQVGSGDVHDPTLYITLGTFGPIVGKSISP